MMNRKLLVGLLMLTATMFMAIRVDANPLSGAIFTTLPDGSEVNFNIYPSKDLVYLDGGPGPGAPQGAAGLDDGIYVFQVTDPSGKTLLSSDEARCRQFDVSDGIISGVVVTGCEHPTGLDVDHGAATVRLMPYNDTPNHGGEYKAWVTPVGDFLTGCEALGVANGLAVVDCGLGHRGNFHGFLGRNSKTDNFKVGPEEPQEIDTRFHRGSLYGQYIDGLGITWTDTLGASNRKWSYWNPHKYIFHEAHVENVEIGTHYFTIENQLNCEIGAIAIDGNILPNSGPQTIGINVKRKFRGNAETIFIDCECID